MSGVNFNDTASKAVNGTGQTLIDRYITPTRSALSADNIDFQTDYIKTKTITDNTTLTVTNPVLGKSVLLEIDSDDNETLTLPVGTVILDGTYVTDGTLNYIFLMCNNTTGPTFLAVIKQP